MARIPDIEAMRHSLQLIQYELEPGDCTVHHALLVHAAPGNMLAARRRRAVVTRWTGDDVRYAPKPKSQPLIRRPTIAAGSPPRQRPLARRDRKSTRLNSSHRTISYAVFCLKKK